MKTYTIGKGKLADINVSGGENARTVSDYHADITVSQGGDTFLVVDRVSTNGTYSKMNGKWKIIDAQRILRPFDELMLGRYKTSIAELFESANLAVSGSSKKIGEGSEKKSPEFLHKPKATPSKLLKGVKPYRDPEGGRVIE